MILPAKSKQEAPEFMANERTIVSRVGAGVERPRGVRVRRASRACDQRGIVPNSAPPSPRRGSLREPKASYQFPLFTRIGVQPRQFVALMFNSDCGARVLKFVPGRHPPQT